MTAQQQNQRPRNRRPPQQRSPRVAAAPLPPVVRTIDPWAPESDGSVRVVLARLAPLLLVLVGVAILATITMIGGVVLVVIGGVVLAVNESIGGPNRVVGRLGGQVVAPGAQPGLRNIVDGLCVASGQAVPELRILDDEAPNAIVLLRRGGAAVLFCTAGLLSDLSRIELEGVIAHELAHVKNGDASRAAHAMAACGALALVSAATPKAVLALGDPRREVLADLGGSAMTRFPRGLGAALDVIARTDRGRVRSIDSVAYRLTAPLWCAPLNEDQPLRTRPGVLDLALRVETLAEL